MVIYFVFFTCLIYFDRTFIVYVYFYSPVSVYIGFELLRYGEDSQTQPHFALSFLHHNPFLRLFCLDRESLISVICISSFSSCLLTVNEPWSDAAHPGPAVAEFANPPRTAEVSKISQLLNFCVTANKVLQECLPHWVQSSTMS